MPYSLGMKRLVLDDWSAASMRFSCELLVSSSVRGIAETTVSILLRSSRLVREPTSE